MSKAKILIVEDNLIEAEDIESYLKEREYQVLPIVTNGRDALLSAQEHQPDIVVMDIDLSDEMDGLTSGKAILKTYDIPVVFLTGKTDDITREVAKEITPFSYLAKPFNGPNLEEKIEELLDRNSKGLPANEQPIMYYQNGKHVVLAANEILYLQGSSMFTNLYKVNSDLKPIILSMPLNHLLDQLSSYSFMVRCHRSYAVNLNQIESLEGRSQIWINGVNEPIPIGKKYKESFISHFNLLHKKVG